MIGRDEFIVWQCVVRNSLGNVTKLNHRLA
jgi:hypothetical protein